MIQHAELFQEAHRMIERQEVEERAEPYTARLARGGGEIDARRRRHRERRRMVLGEMIAGEAGLLRRLQEDQALLIGFLQRLAPVVDIIEYAEFHVEPLPPVAALREPRILEAKLASPGHR